MRILVAIFAGLVDIRSTARYAQLDTADLAEALLDTYGREERP